MQGFRLGQAAEDPLRVKGTLKKGAGGVSRLKKLFLAASAGLGIIWRVNGKSQIRILDMRKKEVDND